MNNPDNEEQQKNNQQEENKVQTDVIPGCGLGIQDNDKTWLDWKY